MPTGRCHCDITAEKSICRPFEKSVMKLREVLNSLFAPLKGEGLNDTLTLLASP
jgi:hypothetical protein